MRRRLTALGVALLAATAGCAQRPFMHETVDAAGGKRVYVMPEGPIELAPVADPVPLRVVLAVDPSVREARWESPWRDARIHVPLAALLPDSVERTARSAFAAVDATAEPAPADAVLRVRFVGAAKTLAGLRRDPSLFALALEWRLEDPAGRLVWADTIVGRSPRPSSGPAPHPTDQIERAFADLLARSQQALASAPEIRALAGEAGS